MPFDGERMIYGGFEVFVSRDGGSWVSARLLGRALRSAAAGERRVSLPADRDDS